MIELFDHVIDLELEFTSCFTKIDVIVISVVVGFGLDGTEV
jgi:hypothetical protein